MRKMQIRKNFDPRSTKKPKSILDLDLSGFSEFALHEPCFIFSLLRAALEGFYKGSWHNWCSAWFTCIVKTILSQQLSRSLQRFLNEVSIYHNREKMMPWRQQVCNPVNVHGRQHLKKPIKNCFIYDPQLSTHWCYQPLYYWFVIVKQLTLICCNFLLNELSTRVINVQF